MFNDLVFNVCMALIVAICGVIAKEVIPYLREKKAEAMKALEATKWAWAVDIIDSVVLAVEQTVIEEHGEEKKVIARRMIDRAFKEMNVYMSMEQIDMLIEAAVGALNHDGERIKDEGC